MLELRGGFSTLVLFIISGAHEPPEGWQRASNYVQWHLILSGFDTFLIWTVPQVGNLPLWSLHIRMKQAQRNACRRALSTSCFSCFSVCVIDANLSIVNITLLGDSKSERLRKL